MFSEVPINYFAVLAAAISSMVLGFLWYGPLFGKQWAVLMGWSKADMEKQKAQASSMNKLYALQFLGSLVMAYVLAHSLVFASTYTQTTGMAAGMMVGFWSWLGFIAPVTLGSILWEGKSWHLWILNNAYQLLLLMLMGVILAVWV